MMVQDGRGPAELGQLVPQQQVGGKGAVGRGPQEGGGQCHREVLEEGLRLHPGSNSYKLGGFRQTTQPLCFQGFMYKLKMGYLGKLWPGEPT